MLSMKVVPVLLLLLFSTSVVTISGSMVLEDEEFSWRSMSGYGKSRRCVEIPEELRLCHGVGYTQMQLPNLLDHDNMAEVRQQAGGWVPLVRRQCHPATQVLLCSLFAPVCLEHIVYPCRWLCEAVREKCSPVMEAYGFTWPEMLNCNKFPQNDVCVATNNTDVPRSGPTAAHLSFVCPPCDSDLSADAILEHTCASEFAIKTKIKEARNEALDKKVILQKKVKVVKQGPLQKKDLKKMVLYLKNGADCLCQQLENSGTNYLVTGRRLGMQYLLTGIHKWDKTSAEFRKALKKLKTHKCPEFEGVFK